MSTTTEMPIISTGGMPTISATGQTTTWTTPIITPPSASNNPNIWRSRYPTGLVFIVVGAIAGFFLLCFLLFLFITKYFAKRNAQKSLQLTDSAASSYNSGSAEKLGNPFYQTASQSTSQLFKSQSQNKIPLLYENNKVITSVSDVSDIHTRPAENTFSTLTAEDNTKKKFMFISPTAEVMSYNKKQHYHQRMMSSMSNLSITPNGCHYAGSSSQIGGYHERTESYENYTDTFSQPPEKRGSNRNRKVPSQYLESMFED